MRAGPSNGNDLDHTRFIKARFEFQFLQALLEMSYPAHWSMHLTSSDRLIDQGGDLGIFLELGPSTG